jgi:hypothetical protein
MRQYGSLDVASPSLDGGCGGWDGVRVFVKGGERSQ